MYVWEILVRGRGKKSMLELITVNSGGVWKSGGGDGYVCSLLLLFFFLSLSHYLRGGFVVSRGGRADAIRAFWGGGGAIGTNL